MKEFQDYFIKLAMKLLKDAKKSSKLRICLMVMLKNANKIFVILLNAVENGKKFMKKPKN